MFHTKLITDKLLRHPNIIFDTTALHSVLVVRMCQVFTNSPFSLLCGDADAVASLSLSFGRDRLLLLLLLLIPCHLITLNLVSGVGSVFLLFLRSFHSFCSFFFCLMCLFFHQRRSHITLHGYCCAHYTHNIMSISSMFALHIHYTAHLISSHSKYCSIVVVVFLLFT